MDRDNSSCANSSLSKEEALKSDNMTLEPFYILCYRLNPAKREDPTDQINLTDRINAIRSIYSIRSVHN